LIAVSNFLEWIKRPEIPVVDLVMVVVKLGLAFWLLLGSNGIVTDVRAVWAKGKPYNDRG